MFLEAMVTPLFLINQICQQAHSLKHYQSLNLQLKFWERMYVHDHCPMQILLRYHNDVLVLRHFDILPYFSATFYDQPFDEFIYFSIEHMVQNQMKHLLCNQINLYNFCSNTNILLPELLQMQDNFVSIFILNKRYNSTI